MERVIPELTIDPYAARGIMGSDVELNTQAAERFMKSADMRRAIVVSKQEGSERNSAENPGEVLAIQRIAIPTLRQWQSKHHEITKETGSYKIALDDQAIWNKADARVAKKHKRGGEESGHSILRKEFLRGLNAELASSLKEVVKDEKLGFQDQQRNYKLVVAGFVMAHSIYALFDFAANTAPDSQELLFRSLYYYALLMGYINIFVNGDNRRIEVPTLPPRLREDLHFSPIPVDSYVRGYYQILRNHSRFILERSQSSLDI